MARRSYRTRRLRLSRVCRGRALAIIILLPSLAGSAIPLTAQSRSIAVSVGTHSLTVPWHTGPVANRFNPAAMIGTDHALKSGNHWSLFYALNVGFFRNYWWMTGVSFEPEVGVGRTLLGGLRADLRLGLGYLHYFWRRKTLELEDGSYVRATDLGRPSLIVPLSATLGYRGTSSNPVRVAPFLAARWGVQALFQEEVPVMTHFLLLAGIRFQRGRATPRGGR